MNRYIYRHEVRIRIRSVLIWGFSMMGLVFFFFSFFTTFAKQAALTAQLLSNYPPALLEAFGLNRMDMSTVGGYFGFLTMFMSLCLAIQACNFGFGLVSIEENEMTADFLLTKPVSRVQVLTSKLLAAMTSLLLTDLVVWAACILAATTLHGDRGIDWKVLILLLLTLPILQFFFMSVGVFISLLLKRIRSVTPWSLGLTFGTYVLNAFSGVFGDVKLEYLTPFKHLDPAYIVEHAAYNTPLLLINIAISLAAVGASYWLYLRRDIHAVS